MFMLPRASFPCVSAGFLQMMYVIYSRKHCSWKKPVKWQQLLYDIASIPQPFWYSTMQHDCFSWTSSAPYYRGHGMTMSKVKQNPVVSQAKPF